MTQAHTALLPCPFCGGAPHSMEPWEIGTSDTYTSCVECTECDYSLEHNSTSKHEASSQAAAKWNRRVPTEPIAALTKRIELIEAQISPEQK